MIFFVTSTPSGFCLKHVKEGFLTGLYIKTNYIDHGAEGPLALLFHSWIDNEKGILSHMPVLAFSSEFLIRFMQ